MKRPMFSQEFCSVCIPTRKDSLVLGINGRARQSMLCDEKSPSWVKDQKMATWIAERDPFVYGLNGAIRKEMHSEYKELALAAIAQEQQEQNLKLLATALYNACPDVLQLFKSI